MRFGWQVCWLRAVNLQVHCVGGSSEFFPSVRKELQLAVNPQTGQFGGQTPFHFPELWLAVLRDGHQATRSC